MMSGTIRWNHRHIYSSHGHRRAAAGTAVETEVAMAVEVAVPPALEKVSLQIHGR